MITTTQPVPLTVVSAGLSNPSSTRLLADRLTESVSEHLAEAGREVGVQVVERRDWLSTSSRTSLAASPRPQRRGRRGPARRPTARTGYMTPQYK
ncbi:hypothetical protein [Streptomyces sp. NPDC096311]|uniref:hypothetical protein n=1 Tax=Streptomyces sp. NPDC096311 TaxID=3366083 RepID=UPI0038137167